MSDFNSGDVGSAVSTAASATVNHSVGSIVTEALTTAAGSDYVFTLHNSLIYATSCVFVSVQGGTNTTTGLAVHEVTSSPGGISFISIRNDGVAPLNGTIVITFLVI